MKRGFLVLSVIVALCRTGTADAQQVGDTAVLSSRFAAYPITNPEEVLRGKLPRYANAFCHVPVHSKLKIVYDWGKDIPNSCKTQPGLPCLVTEFVFPPVRTELTPFCPNRAGKMWSAVSARDWKCYKNGDDVCE